MAIETINPNTNKLVKSFEKTSDEKIKSIILNSEKAYQQWKQTTFQLRSKLLFKTADVLRNNKNKYAEIMTLEMGKPISQAFAEVEKCA